MRLRVPTAALCLLATLACGPELAHRAHAQAKPEPAMGVLLDTGKGVPEQLIELVDAVLLERLDKLSDYQSPSVSPASYLDVQLMVGCAGSSYSCLESIARLVQVQAVVVRRLHVDEHGTTTLQLLAATTAEGHGLKTAQATRGAEGQSAIVEDVPRLVQQLFPAREPAPPQVAAAPEPNKAPKAAAPEPNKAPKAAAPEPGVEPVAPVAPERAVVARDASRSGSLDASSGGPDIAPLSWVTAITGAALLAAGVVVGVSAQARFDDVKRIPVQTPGDADRVRQRFNDVETLGTVANIVLPAGGAVLAAGVLLIGLDLGAGPSSEDVAGLSWQLAPLRHGGSLVVSGHFEVE